MTNRETLMASIITNPADDAPRLIFADWLEEHDEPEHAEFIRLQIEKLKCPKCGGRGTYSLRAAGGLGMRGIQCDIPRCLALRKREVELLIGGNGRQPGRIWDEWNPLGDRGWTNLIIDDSDSHTGIRFVRGFVEHVRLDPRDFFQHARDMMARTPLRKVEFTREPEYTIAGANRMARWFRSRECPDATYYKDIRALPRPDLPDWHRLCLAEFGEGIEFSVVPTGNTAEYPSLPAAAAGITEANNYAALFASSASGSSSR